jgi:DNA-directed RNA polymerase subunit beta
MQSLALDVNVVSEEGERAEMREEDDDLLRAAEELGIDLSGVRAGNGDGTSQPEAADEATEREDSADAVAAEPEEEEVLIDPDLATSEALATEDLATTEDPMIEDTAEAEGAET